MTTSQSTESLIIDLYFFLSIFMAVLQHHIKVWHSYCHIFCVSVWMKAFLEMMRCYERQSSHAQEALDLNLAVQFRS